jgi:hypothetical protein
MQNDTAHYIAGIMQGSYDTVQDIQYRKLYNDHFEIITKKRNCVVVIDKRQVPYNVYNDIKLAYRRIVIDNSLLGH